MQHRLADWLDRQPPARRRLFSLLIAVILLTLPCYAAGVMLLVISGAEPSAAVPPVEQPASVTTPMAGTASPFEMAPTPVERQSSGTVAAPTDAPTLITRPLLPQITIIPTLFVATETAESEAPTALPVPTATVPPTIPQPVGPSPTIAEAVPVITQPIVLPPAILTRMPAP
jgi:hypothetical protein